MDSTPAPRKAASRAIPPFGCQDSTAPRNQRGVPSGALAARKMSVCETNSVPAAGVGSVVTRSLFATTESQPISSRGIYNALCGQIIARHICATGEPSKPSPCSGCRKFRPITSTNSATSTVVSGSNEYKSFNVMSRADMYQRCARANLYAS